jgi:transcriptional regulator GlxA family with amidase domain
MCFFFVVFSKQVPPCRCYQDLVCVVRLEDKTGLPIPMHGGLEELEQADAVLVMSGPGVQDMLEDANFLDVLRRLDPQRLLIGSMCSGALLLAAAGLLKGRTATTYYTRMKQLAKYEVEVVNEPFVRHGNVATAAGCLAAIDLARWVIGKLVSEAMAERVVRSVQPNQALPSHSP